MAVRWRYQRDRREKRVQIWRWEQRWC